jgi:hypothetical protein
MDTKCYLSTPITAKDAQYIESKLFAEINIIYVY